MNALTDDSKRLKHTHRTDKRGVEFTGRGIDRSDRDSSLLVPNIYDPDFYCRVCGTTEANLSDYVKHLILVHQIVEDHVQKKNMKTTYKKEMVSSTNALKADESEEDCDDDEENFKLYDSENDDMTISNNDTCNDKVDLCVTSRQQRCGKRIAIKKSTSKENDGNANFNINHPNHYCHCCRKRYATRGAFRFHLKTVHQIQNIPVKPRDLHRRGGTAEHDFIPDMDDDKTLIDQLVNTTAIKNQQPLSITINRKEPAVDDKTKNISNQYYCNNCTINLKNSIRYQIHVQTYHPTTTNPNTKTDNNTYTTPNTRLTRFYCQSCKISKRNRRSYLMHLLVIHKISLSSTLNN